MYRVELIPKQSVIDDILTFWKATGREPGLDKGEFVFEAVNYAEVTSSGTLRIDKLDNTYFYNISDFYRVKVIIKES